MMIKTIIRLAGLTAFIWQIVQFFYSKWNYDWWVEFAALALFGAIAYKPSNITSLFEAFKKKTVGDSAPTNTISNISSDTGTGDIPKDEEV